jgi:hypothetical protein
MPPMTFPVRSLRQDFQKCSMEEEQPGDVFEPMWVCACVCARVRAYAPCFGVASELVSD